MSGFELPRPLDWMAQALCAQIDVGDIFFPEPGRSNKAAKSVCANCEVRVECLAWGLKNDERYGVLGGLGEADRAALRKGERRARRLKPINHGTDAGAAAHRYRGEPPCDRCAQAANVAWSMRQNKDECPVCGVLMLRSSIRRHIERRHPNAGSDVA